MPLHISMSFNNRFSMGIWDRLPQNICPFPGSQTQVLTVWFVKPVNQNGGRHSSVLHGFNNQTPRWPLTQGLVENSIVWPVLDRTLLFQLGTLDFPSLPPYLKCGKWLLSAVLTCSSRVEIHWQMGLSLSFVVASLVLCCRWAIVNVSNHTLIPQRECKYFKMYQINVMDPETMGCSDRRDFSALMSVSQAMGREGSQGTPLLKATT